MWQTIPFLVLCLTTSGCLPFLRAINPAEEHLVGAEPMQSAVSVDGGTWDLKDFTMQNSADKNAPDKKTYIGLLLAQSEEKCNAFLGGLSATERAGDTSLDILTTIFSALGTAFTPLATVHAFTAAATISSGTKTAIDSDIYQKETAALIVQAIDNTYYKQYSEYTTALANKSDADVNPAIEYNVIKGFHKECSLDAALAYISSQVKAPNAPSSPAPALATTTLKVNVSGANGATADDTLVLTPTSTEIGYMPSVLVPVKSKQIASTIANDIIEAISKQITANPNYNSISAKLGSDPATIAITSHASDMVEWAASMKNGSISGVNVTSK
jgi:hypothetical protein